MDERTSIYCGEAPNKIVHHQVMVSCCVNCIKFQTVLKTSVWQDGNGVQCKNVNSDLGSDFREEIFVEYSPNELSEINDESGSECEEEITFPMEPFRSCFTDSILNYEHFCKKCQNVF